MAVTYSSTAKVLQTSGVLYNDRRDFYIRPNVVKELWTSVAPFTTVVANQATVTNMPDPLFKLFEHASPWQKQQFANNGSSVTIASAGTESNAITVDGITGLASSIDSSYEGLECEIWNSALTTKKGVVLVTDAASSTTLKVKHLWNPGTAADISTVDNDVFIIVGNAHGEGETAPDAWADELKVVWNSAQIFKVPVEITGTLYQAALRGYSSELARLRESKSSESKIQRERAFLMGGSVLGTNLDYGDTFTDTQRTGASGAGVRTTMGIIPALEEYGDSSSSSDTQNVFTITEATYKYSDFVDDTEKVFQYVPTSGMRRAFCGMGAMSYWSKMGGSSGFAAQSGWSVRLSDMRQDRLGFNFKILETPHGLFQLIPTPVLRGPYNKYMLVVSEEDLFHAIYRPAMFKANIKTDDDYDGVKDLYFNDEGIGITNIAKHSLWHIV